jgi:hypothetical protein
MYYLNDLGVQYRTYVSFNVLPLGIIWHIVLMRHRWQHLQRVAERLEPVEVRVNPLEHGADPAHVPVARERVAPQRHLARGDTIILTENDSNGSKITV